MKVTATNSCGSYAEGFVFYLSSGMVKAYPNPATDKITLEFANLDLLEAMPTKVDLYSEKAMAPVRTVDVKEVYEKKSFTDGNKIDLDVSALP